MAIRWSFCRERDKDKIVTEELNWEGPFCLPKYENADLPTRMPDKEAVYLFCFPFEGGFVLENAGVTKSTKRRIAAHISEYKNGGYNIFDMEAISRLERIEIWHGWSVAKQAENRRDFMENRDYYAAAIERQLSSYRLFLAPVEDQRKRERIEAAMMINAYVCKEAWADIAPRWMHLKGRYNHEMPIEVRNVCKSTIVGVPDTLEI